MPAGWSPDPLTQLVEQVKTLEKDVAEIAASIKSMSVTMSKNYVTQDQFKPVKLIVFGMVGTILLAVLSLVLSYAFKQPVSPVISEPSHIMEKLPK